MLIVNEKKGWFGSFSEAGKRAAKMNILLSKDELSKMTTKKIPNSQSLLLAAFESAENKQKQRIVDDDDELDIFTINEPDKNKLEAMAKEGIKKTNQKLKESEKNDNKNKIKKNNNYSNDLEYSETVDPERQRYFYHERHMKKGVKKYVQENPPCTKYNPKFDAILKRSLSLPLWKTMTGRKPIKVEYDHQLGLEHSNIEATMAGKSFIDMKKQTDRKPFIPEKKNDPLYYSQSIEKNSLNVSEADFIKLTHETTRRPKSSVLRKVSGQTLLKKKNLGKNNFRYNKLQKNDSGNIVCRPQSSIVKSSNKSYKSVSGKEEITPSLIEHESIQKSKEILENESVKSNDSYDLYKDIYIKKNRKKKDKTKIKTQEKKKIIKAPDFKKIISREHLNKLVDDKVAVVPYLLPNFKSVRERPIMMVVYDRKKHKINKSKSDELAKIDNTYYYDPNLVLDRINNHSQIHAPNFKMMTSRPDDKDPLPSYMKNLFSKNASYAFTAQSLKLNNYSNRGFIMYKSSFWPKLSYNKIINLNLLRSKKFLNNVIGDQKAFAAVNKSLGKSLQFYNKNYDEILKEDILSRFDNVTYKAIDKQNTKPIKELMKDVNENKPKEDFLEEMENPD